MLRKWRRFLVPPRVLIVSTALALVGCACANFSLSPLLMGSSCVVGLLLGLAASSLRLACLWALTPLLFYGNVVMRTPRASVDDVARLNGYFTSFTGQVRECKASNGTYKIIVSVASRGQQRLSGNCLVELSKPLPWAQLQANDIVEITGRIAVARHSLYPWQFDYADYLARKGIACTCRALDIKVRERNTISGLSCAFDQARSKITSVHAALIGPKLGNLLTSIVLGDRAVAVPEQITNDFRDVGLSHTLAASGFNLALVVFSARWIAQLVIRKRLWLNLFCLPWIVGFVMLAGPSPSILRAALMIMLALTVSSLFRQTHTMAVLALSLCLSMAVLPTVLQNVGFQLSYLATFGIVGGATQLVRLFAGAGICIHLRKWIAEALSVILLVQASILPVQLYYFWKMGLLFAPANFIVTPILPAVTVLGFMSCLLALPARQNDWLYFVCSCLDQICASCLRVILDVVECLKGTGFSALNTGPPSPTTVMLYFAALAIFVVSLKSARYRLFTAGLLAAATYVLFLRPPLPAPMVATFQDCVVIIDTTHHYLILGSESNKEANKFIQYFGGRRFPDREQSLNVCHKGIIDAIKYCCTASACVFVVDLGHLDLNHNCTLTADSDELSSSAGDRVMAVIDTTPADTKHHEHFHGELHCSEREQLNNRLDEIARQLRIRKLLPGTPGIYHLLHCAKRAGRLHNAWLVNCTGGCSVAVLTRSGSNIPLPGDQFVPFFANRVYR